MPIAKRAVALARERPGEDHTKFASAISWLASVYKAQGRYAEAETLYKRDLAITEKALERFPLDVNRNSYGGFPRARKSNFEFLRRQRRGRAMARGYSKDLRVRAVSIVETGESPPDAHTQGVEHVE